MAGYGSDASGNAIIAANGVNQVKVDTSGNLTLLNGVLMAPQGISMPTAFAYRNRAINGSLVVQQRSSVAAVAGGGNQYGGPDRFFAALSSTATGGFTQSASTIAVGSVAFPCVKQTVTTISTSFGSTNLWYGISHPFEGYNVYDLVGKPFSISFWFYTNVTGNFSVSVTDATAAYSFLSQFAAVAGTPTYVTILVPASALLTIPVTSATGLTVEIGALQAGTFASSTLNVWQAGNYRAVGSNTNWAATVGNFISAGQFQLEMGTVTTPFEMQRYSDILLQCQRYYEIGQLGNSYMNSVSSPAAHGSMPFMVRKRAAPTNTYSGWQYYSEGTPASFTPADYAPNTTCIQWLGNGLTGWNGWTSGGLWSSSAEL